MSEKIYADDTPDKGSKHIRNLCNLTLKKNQTIKIWADDLNRYFSKEVIQMPNRHMMFNMTNQNQGSAN